MLLLVLEVSQQVVAERAERAGETLAGGSLTRLTQAVRRGLDLVEQIRDMWWSASSLSTTGPRAGLASRSAGNSISDSCVW